MSDKTSKKGVYIDHEYNGRVVPHPARRVPNSKQPERKSVILDGPPPALEVSSLNVAGAVEVHSLLFESAYKDRRWDKRKGLPWFHRLDAGATTEWSIKGLAGQLHIGKEKVRRAIDALLKAGFIRVLGYVSSRNGSKKRLFQVIKYNQLENYRAALAVSGSVYGKTTQALVSNYPAADSPFEECLLLEDRIDSVFDCETEDTVNSCTEFLEEDYDPGFCGLWEGDFTQNVQERLSTYADLLKSCKL